MAPLPLFWQRFIYGGIGGASPTFFNWAVTMQHAANTDLDVPTELGFCLLHAGAVFIFFGLGAVLAITAKDRAAWKMIMIGISLPSILTSAMQATTFESKKE